MPQTEEAQTTKEHGSRSRIAYNPELHFRSKHLSKSLSVASVAICGYHILIHQKINPICVMSSSPFKTQPTPSSAKPFGLPAVLSILPNFPMYWSFIGILCRFVFRLLLWSLPLGSAPGLYFPLRPYSSWSLLPRHVEYAHPTRPTLGVLRHPKKTTTHPTTHPYLDRGPPP